MKIRKLSLRDFRVFREPEPFSFSDHFTVVAGINGRGKTAVLDAIAHLVSRLLPQISPAPTSYRPLRDRDCHNGKLSLRLGLSANCAGVPIEFSLTHSCRWRSPPIPSLPSALRAEVRRAYGDKSREDDAAPIAVYFTTDRAGYRLPRTIPRSIPKGRAAAYSGGLINRTVNFRDFIARFRLAELEEREAQNGNAHFLGARAAQAIREALGTFLGGYTNLRVQEQPPRILLDKDGATLEVSQLSDGERSFLAIVCDLSRRLALANPGIENPLEGEGLVLIDELELHLHPTWQREVVDKLRKTFPNLQFIATTHSPFIIQALRPGELINLDPEEFAEYSDQSIENIAEGVMGIDVPQKSRRWLDMMAAAEVYFRLLRNPAMSESQLKAAELRYTELAVFYGFDPTFQAILKLERELQQRTAT